MLIKVSQNIYENGYEKLIFAQKSNLIRIRSTCFTQNKTFLLNRNFWVKVCVERTPAYRLRGMIRRNFQKIIFLFFDSLYLQKQHGY